MNRVLAGEAALGLVAVGAVEEVDNVDLLHRDALAPGAERELHAAAWIGRDDNADAGCYDVGHLLIENLNSNVVVGQVVDAGTAATDVAVFHLHQLETGDLAQQLPRLVADALAM